MKNAVSICILASTLLVASARVGPGASAAAQGGPQAGSVPPTLVECLQECFDQLQRSNRTCRSVCYRCYVSFFGVCVVSGTDHECFTSCTGKAQQAYDRCAARCNRAT